MLESTHRVCKDVFDPASGDKLLSVGQEVKAIDLGDHYFVWTMPFSPTRKPVQLKRWVVTQSLEPLQAAFSDA